MKQTDQDFLHKLHAVTKKKEEEKEKTALELFYEADEIVETLAGLLEEAVEAYNDAKEVLFREAGLLKGPKPVDQLKG